MLLPYPVKQVQVAVRQQRRDDSALRRTFAVGFAAAHILPGAILVLPDDRRFEPLLDDVQYRTVNDALGYDGQQFGVGDAVEVFRQVGIYDLGIATMKGIRYFIDRIMGGFLWPEPVGVRAEIRFKYRFDDELHRHLGYPVADRRYPQRTLTSVRFGYHDAPHRTWLVSLVFQVLS